METNNLINIKGLCHELLDYLATNKEDIPTGLQKSMVPKLKKLLSLVETLPETNQSLSKVKPMLDNEDNSWLVQGSKNSKLPKKYIKGGGENFATNFNTKIAGVVNTLKIMWQQDLPEKILLARRGMDWLGQDSKQDEVSFLNKMVSLGELISEDKKLKHSSKKAVYSKEEAKKMRDQLSHDKEFISAIYNKNHAKHSSSLARLHHLNSIIAG